MDESLLSEVDKSLLSEVDKSLLIYYASIFGFLFFSSSSLQGAVRGNDV